jgi:predicted Zn-dependent protease
VLAVLGAGAASSVLANLGCGAAAPSVAAQNRTLIDGEDVRAWLRAAVAQLRADYPSASAHAVIARRTTAAIDLHGRGVVRRQHAAVVLRVDDGKGHVSERATSAVTADAIAKLVASLRAPKATGAADVAFGAPVRSGTSQTAPERTDAGWLELVSALDGRAEAKATSRVIYRGVWIDSDDAMVWHVGAGTDAGTVVDREQRLIRTRSGVVMMSWSGTQPMVGQVERGAVGGPDKVDVSDDDIARAALGALELTTPGAVPAGDVAVLLMPSVVARLADAALAPVLTTAAWRRPDLGARAFAGAAVGSAAISIATDPDPGRYGGYHFDDEGTPCGRALLIEAGVLRGPVADRTGAASGVVGGAGLRPGHSGPAAPAIGHLAWAPGPGTAAPDVLETELDDAWIIDGGSDAHVDPITWTVTIEVARARRVRSGARTGHVHAGVELAAAVPALLAATTRVSSTVETFVARDGGGADARWRSLEVPAIVTRAHIGPRRPA